MRAACRYPIRQDVYPLLLSEEGNSMKKTVRKKKRSIEQIEFEHLEHIKELAIKYDLLIDKFIRTMENMALNGVQSEGMDIGSAIKLMKAGGRISKESWKNKQIYLSIKCESNHPNENYICVKTVSNYFVPWYPNSQDLLSTDWFLIKS